VKTSPACPAVIRCCAVAFSAASSCADPGARSRATRAARTTRPAPLSRQTWSSLPACTAPGHFTGRA